MINISQNNGWLEGMENSKTFKTMKRQWNIRITGSWLNGMESSKGNWITIETGWHYCYKFYANEPYLFFQQRRQFIVKQLVWTKRSFRRCRKTTSLQNKEIQIGITNTFQCQAGVVRRPTKLSSFGCSKAEYPRPISIQRLVTATNIKSTGMHSETFSHPRIVKSNKI